MQVLYCLLFWKIITFFVIGYFCHCFWNLKVLPGLLQLQLLLHCSCHRCTIKMVQEALKHFWEMQIDWRTNTPMFLPYCISDLQNMSITLRYLRAFFQEGLEMLDYSRLRDNNWKVAGQTVSFLTVLWNEEQVTPMTTLSLSLSVAWASEQIKPPLNVWRCLMIIIGPQVDILYLTEWINFQQKI